MHIAFRISLLIIYLFEFLHVTAMTGPEFHKLLEKEKFEEVAAALEADPHLIDIKGGEHPPVHALVTAVTGMIDPTPDKHVVLTHSSASKMQLIRLLIDKGADVNMFIPEFGVRIIDIAASVASVEVIEFLLQAGADPLLPITVQGTKFSTAKIACFWGNIPAMQAIVKKAPSALDDFADVTWGDQVAGVPGIFETNIPSCKEAYLKIKADVHISKQMQAEEL